MVEQNYSAIKDLQGYFKEGERKAMFVAAQSSRDKLLIRMLWVTGRRITEILDIRIHEIDFQINKIAFHIEKKTERVNGVRQKKDLVKLKPIDDFTVRLIKAYIAESNLSSDKYLFESEFNPGRPITRQRAYDIVRWCAEKAGIEQVGGCKPHPHHFRHSYAIDMARKMKSPSDVRKLQMMMEHSNLAVTEQYLQFSDEELKEMTNVGD
jgi:integrase